MEAEVRELEGPIARAVAIVLKENPGEVAIDRLASILRTIAARPDVLQQPAQPWPAQPDPSLPHVLESALREAVEQIMVEQPPEPLVTLADLLEQSVREMRSMPRRF